jgi:membrane-bound lytic murein transglycosylase D
MARILIRSFAAFFLFTSVTLNLSSAAEELSPAVTTSVIDGVLNDANHRIIDETFHVPSALKGSVSFWLKIYTQYSSRQLVIYDLTEPSHIYEVMDFRDIAKSARNEMAFEIMRNRRISKTVSRYRSAFRHLAKNPNPPHPTLEEVAILRALPKVVSHFNFALLSEHLRTQSGQSDNISKGLAVGKNYFPRMEDLFLRMGLPVELTRLCLVESSFDLRSHSRAGATGVWQFLPSSGKEFLMIDDQYQIDERVSPLKATVAAGRLLKRNYVTLKNWALAITAYNHGMGGLLRGHSSPNPRKIWDLFNASHSRLGFASKNYYAEFLAVLHAEAYRDIFFRQPEIGAEVSRADPIALFTQFEKLKRPTLAEAFSKARGISLRVFQLLNPDIRDIHRPIPPGFKVALPTQGDDLTGLM